MSIGSVGSATPATPAPDEPVAPDTSATTTDTATTAPVRTTAPSGRAAVGAAVTSATPPRAADIVPERILARHGLDPNKLTTANEYKGEKWNVGYYPYDGDIQYVAFGKYRDVFGKAPAMADAHAYWEMYSNPPGGLEPGSWIASGSIRESDFERSTGVDVSGDRPIDNAAYKLLRESGAPASALFALRDASGKQHAIQPGDKLVPTIEKDGKFVEVEVRGDGEYYRKGTDEALGWNEKVVWRLKGSDGQIRGARNDKAEDRFDLAGAKENVKFDFLDATGEPVPYSPPSDRIVATYKDREGWHAFVPKRDASGRVTSYEHQKLDADGRRVLSRETVDEARMKELRRGKEVIWRVQSSSGSLQGDGKVGDAYDMSWWGKCHNVASIGASSMPLPEKDVKIVTNRGPGEKVGLEWREGSMHNVLIPKKNRSGAITGYTLRQQGGVTGGTTTRELSKEEGDRLAAEKNATPVIVRRNGSLKPAEVTTVDREEVTAMVAHMGDGGVEYKGSVGARYYGVPDQIRLRDGSTTSAFIVGAELESGKKVDIGAKEGSGDYSERDRSILRAPGLTSREIYSGWRTIAWSSMDFQRLQASKTDKIKSLTVVHPDGRKETISADKIASLGWENRYDIKPTDLFEMHKKVGEKGSSVIEADPGTHVWNYTIEGIATTPLKRDQIPSHLRDRADRPGMMAGTTGDEGKYFFKTEINGNEYYYWAKFDEQGNLKDYAYLSDRAPDFFWTQHVKDPYASKWEGEAQAPGADMRDIQKLYLASVGGLRKYELPGGYLSTSDLNRRPSRPER